MERVLYTIACFISLVGSVIMIWWGVGLSGLEEHQIFAFPVMGCGTFIGFFALVFAAKSKGLPINRQTLFPSWSSHPWW